MVRGVKTGGRGPFNDGLNYWDREDKMADQQPPEMSRRKALLMNQALL
jgi:hypothetical protein